MNIYENTIELIKTVKSLNENVLIVGASKTKSCEDILEAKEAGIKIFAENKVQEFVAKKDNVDVTWHFIGRLQRNKVKFLVGFVDIIHSVDSVALALEIDKKAKDKNIVQKILIEVNGSEEQSKGGVFPKDVKDFLNEISILKNIKVVGIMPVLQIGAKESDYQKMNELFCQLKQIDENIKYLSMGMTNDFEIAIKNGANIVRIGSKIFGNRHYNI